MKKEYKIFTCVSRIGFENGVNFAGMKIDSIIARISIYKWQSKREFISRARRSYRLNEFHRRETVPSYLIWTSRVPPRDSNSRFEFHGCQSKERKKERELVKTYVKRERGEKWILVCAKERWSKINTDTGGRKEGRLDREGYAFTVYIFRTMRIPSIVNDSKRASGAWRGENDDRKRVIASRQYLIDWLFLSHQRLTTTAERFEISFPSLFTIRAPLLTSTRNFYLWEEES